MKQQLILLSCISLFLLGCGQQTKETTSATVPPPAEKAKEVVVVNEPVEMEFEINVVGDDGDQFHYQWDFGDGSKKDGSITVSAAEQTVKASHVYEKAGKYKVTLSLKELNVVEYGPEMLGLKLGMLQETAKQALVDRGYIYADKIWIGGEMRNFTPPSDDLWVPAEGEMYTLKQRQMDTGDLCQPTMVGLLIENGILAAVYIEEPGYQSECKQVYNEVLTNFEKMDFGGTEQASGYEYSEETTAGFYRDDSYIIRSVIGEYDWSGGGELRIYFEGKALASLAPEISIDGARKRPPHFVTHIGYPMPLNARGVDLAVNAPPRFEWDKNYSESGSGFVVDADGPTATFEWEEAGTYSVALRGTSIKGQTSMQVVEVRVTPNVYDESNMTIPQLVLEGLPNEILQVDFGSEIDVQQFSETILAKVQNVSAIEVYQSGTQFSGFKLTGELPSFVEYPSLYKSIVDPLDSEWGEPTRVYWGEEKGDDFKIWQQQDLTVKVAGTLRSSHHATVWVLYSPLWTEEVMSIMLR